MENAEHSPPASGSQLAAPSEQPPDQFEMECRTVPLPRAPLPHEQVCALYDRIGARNDWLRPLEAAPKRWALAQLAIQPGERVLEVGMGTGRVLVALARASGFQVVRERA